MNEPNYYTWYKEHGICVDCHCEKAFYNRTKCAECLWKDAERQRERRKNMSPLQKQNTARNSSKNHKNLYYDRKTKGLCTKCGKHKAVLGITKCAECRLKYNRYMREFNRKTNDILPFELKGNGVYCSVCGKPVENIGSKFCNRCYDNNIIKLKKAWNNSKNSVNPDNWHNKKFDFRKEIKEE